METRGGTAQLRQGERQLHAAHLLAERPGDARRHAAGDGARRASSCASSARTSAARSGSRPAPIRNIRRCWWRRRRSAGRCTGWRRAPRRACPTTRRATCSPRASSRSTTRANSWRCACATWSISAPSSGRWRRISPPTTSPAAFPAMYRIEHLDIQVRCAFTNTIPTAPFRGAGRPEANYILERLVDEASRITGIDRDKIRRRNLIPPKAIPFKTAVGTTYDSGDFPAVFDKAMGLADFAGFCKRRREAHKRGKRRGLGISCLLEHSGGTPTESAALEFTGDGRLMVVLGVHSTGQGHATVYRRLAAERLGIAADRIFVRQGDIGARRRQRRLGRLALDHDGRHRAGAHRRDADREGPEARRQRAGGGRAGHRLSRRHVRGDRHRPPRRPVRARARGGRAQEARRDRGEPRHPADRRHAADLSERLPHRRGRDRSRHRRDRRC